MSDRHLVCAITLLTATINQLGTNMSAINDAAAALTQAVNDLAARVAALGDATAVQAELNQLQSDVSSAVDVLNAAVAEIGTIAAG